MLNQHEIEFRVRYKETDSMGVVHHANYLPWFEMGRTEQLRAAGGDYRAVEESGIYMVIVRATCRYIQPAKYDDLLRLVTRTVRVTAAKIEHEYELYRGETLLARAETTLACVDKSGRVQRVPEWLRNEEYR